MAFWAANNKTAFTCSVRWVLMVLSAAILAAAPTIATPAADIVNGQPAGRGAFPWQAGIFFNGGSFCGATLISDEWLLTAAHCVYGAKNFQVMLGATRVYDDEPGKIKIGIRKAIYHPEYNPNTSNNDVAVMQLDRRIPFSQTIYPISLAHSRDYLRDNTRVRVSGWGKTSDQAHGMSNVLNYVDLTTISNYQCKQYFNPTLIQDYVVCCDGSSIQSICQGDVGGPLVRWDGDAYTAVGISSFVSIRGCAVGNPSGFTRIASFIGFINANTGLNFP